MSEPIPEANPPQARQAEHKLRSALYRGPLDRLRLAKTSYSVRRVDLSDVSDVVTNVRPNAGDLVLARVKRLGQHQHLEFGNGRRCRLWPGDEIVVAFGARYAPDQYEAVVPDDLSPCHLVAGGGIAARVVSRHANIKPATDIEPLGLLVNSQGLINVRSAALGSSPNLRPSLVVAVVGSSMNAGKTTTAANLIVGLRRRRLRVGAAKITGTGAGGDPWLLTDAGASPVLDFTDSGFATTAGLPLETLEHILTHLIGHIASSGVDCVVLEVADGLLQQETAALVESHRFAKTVDAVLFAAADAMSAIAGVDWLRRRNLTVAAVSGLVTASPLARREAAREVGIPVLTIEELATEQVVCELFPVIGRLLAVGAVA
jgi:molybdopterin-guanine dinucleotide biosynthesis protein